MSRTPDEPGSPNEPGSEAGEGEDAQRVFDFYAYDKRRREMLKETLGVTLRLSQVQYTDADGQLVTESYKVSISLSGISLLQYTLLPHCQKWSFVYI